jgi:hypothetical protein
MSTNIISMGDYVEGYEQSRPSDTGFNLLRGWVRAIIKTTNGTVYSLSLDYGSDFTIYHYEGIHGTSICDAYGEVTKLEYKSLLVNDSHVNWRSLHEKNIPIASKIPLSYYT